MTESLIDVCCILVREVDLSKLHSIFLFVGVFVIVGFFGGKFLRDAKVFVVCKSLHLKESTTC